MCDRNPVPWESLPQWGYKTSDAKTKEDPDSTRSRSRARLAFLPSSLQRLTRLQTGPTFPGHKSRDGTPGTYGVRGPVNYGPQV